MEEKFRRIREMFPFVKNDDIMEVFRDMDSTASIEDNIDKFEEINERNKNGGHVPINNKPTSNDKVEAKEKPPIIINDNSINSDEESEIEQRPILIKDPPNIFAYDLLKQERNEIHSLVQNIVSMQFDLGPLLPDDELDEVKLPINIYAILNEDENNIATYLQMKNEKYENIVKITLTNSNSNEALQSFEVINSDKLFFSAPKFPGDYVIKAYLKNDIIVESNVVHIPKYDKLSLEFINVDERKKLRKVIVKWEIKVVDVSKKDYISLCTKDGTGIASEYIKNESSLTFDVPRIPGEYVLKYWSHILRDVVAISDTIIVNNYDKIYGEYNSDGRITITWDIYSVDRTTKDWIGIFKQGENNKNYVSFSYVPSDLSETQIRLARNGIDIPGMYVVRYFAKKKPGYDHLVESEPFRIL